MKDYLSSSSALTAIDRWNQQQRQRYPGKVGTNWAELYFPPHMFYLRLLTPAERATELVEDDVLGEVVCGVFDSMKSELIAAADDTDHVLFRKAHEQETILCYRQ